MADNSTKIVITAEDRASAQLGKVGKSLDGLGATAAGAARSIASLAAPLAAGLGAGALVSQLVSVQREFDKINSSLVTVVGSTEGAKQAFAGIAAFAAKTPYSLQEVSNAFIKLKALGLQPTERALTSFGNTASAMGKSLNQMIEAVADAGTGEFERLKEFGIKARQSGDQVALTFQGVTTTIGKSADEITEYLTKIGENQFGGAMARQAATLDGAISNLADSWSALLLTVSSQSVGGIIFDSVKVASGALGDLNAIIREVQKSQDDGAASAERFSLAQEALGTVFETIAVMGANVSFVFETLGKELGGVAAELVALARLDFSGARAIREAINADAIDARQRLDDLTDRILNARRASDAAAPSLDQLAGGMAKTGGAAETAAKSIKAQANALGDLLTKLNAKNIGIDADYGKNLGLLSAGLASGRLSAVGYAEALALLNQQQGFYTAAVKAAAEAEKSALAERQKRIDAAQKEAASLAENVARAREENEEIGLTAEALDALRLARMDAAIAAKEQALATAEAGEASAAEVQAILHQIDALRELRGLAASSQVKTANARAISEQEKAWENFARDIEQSLTDSLYRAFESGEGFGEAFVDSLKNTLKATVLKVAVQAVVSPVTSGIQSMLGIGGGAAGSGGSMLSAGNSLYNLATGGGILSGFSAGAASVASELALGSAFVGPSATLAGGAVGAGATAAAATGSAAGASALSSVAAAAPYAAAALAVASALGLFDRGGPKSGGDAGYSIDNNLLTYGGDGNQYTPNSANEQVSTMMSGAIDPLLKQIEALGGNIADLNIAFGYDTDPEGTADSSVKWRITDDTFSTGEQNRYYASNGDDAELQAKMAEALNDMLIAVFDAAEFDAATEQLADTLANDLKMPVDQVIATIGPLKTALETLSIPVEQFGIELVNAFGGLDAMTAKMSAYYDLYYSGEEKLAKITSDVQAEFANLGLTMPLTKDGFRDIVESLDLTTDSGREAYAALLEVAPAFATVADAAEAAAAAATQAAAAATQAAAAEARVAAERAAADQAAQRSLLMRLYETMGDDDAVRAMQRDDELAGAESDGQRDYLRAIFAEEDAQREQAILDGLREQLAGLDTAYEDALRQERSAMLADMAAASGREIEALNERARQYGDQAREAKRVAERFSDVVSDLDDFRLSLLAGEDSPLSLDRRYQEALRQFEEAAGSSDADKLAELPGLSRQLLDVSKASRRTAVEYARDQARVLNALNAGSDAARAQEDYSRKQYEAMQAQADSLGRQAALMESQLAAQRAGVDSLNSVQRETSAMIAARIDALKAGILTQAGKTSAAAAAADQAKAVVGISSGGTSSGSTTGGVATGGAATTPEISSGAQAIGDALKEAWIAQHGWTDGWIREEIEKIRAKYQGDLTAAQIHAHNMEIYNFATGNNISSAKLASAIGLEQETILAWAKAAGLPAFAAGGYHSGGMALVGERGPELIYSPPVNVIKNSDMSNIINIVPLLDEIKLLRAEVRGVVGATDKTARLLQRVMPDGDALATREVAA